MPGEGPVYVRRGLQGDACRLQRPQRTRLLAVGIRLGQPGLAHFLDQHAAAREHLHQPGDDGLQQRVKFLAGGRTHLDEGLRAIDAAAVHAVQHQAVQVDVQAGSRAEALDQGDSATLTFVALEPRVVQQMPFNHQLQHLQHRRDQLGLRGQQHAQRNRQRQQALAHRHVGDDVVHQVRCRLRHAPRTASGQKPRRL